MNIMLMASCGRYVLYFRRMRYFLVFVLISAMWPCFGQAQRSAQQPPPRTPSGGADDISGMYTFLGERDFLQVTIEDGGVVSGFVSRFGDTGSDKGVHLDQFFERAGYLRNRLSFKTEVVHNTWFVFDGTVTRGPAVTRAKNGYWIVKGALQQFTTDVDGKTKSKSRDVEFKSLAQPDEN